MIPDSGIIISLDNCKWADGQHQNNVYRHPSFSLTPRPCPASLKSCFRGRVLLSSLCAGNSDFLLLNLGWINHHIHYGISFHHNRLESFRQCPQWDSQSKFFSKSLGSQNTISKWHYTDFPFLWRTKEIGDNCRQATCTYKFPPNFSWPYCSCQQPAYTCPAIARSNIPRYKVSTFKFSDKSKLRKEWLKTA